MHPRRSPAGRTGRVVATLVLLAALATGCRLLPDGASPTVDLPRMTPGDRLPSPTIEIPPPID